MDFVEALQLALEKGWVVFRNTLSSLAASLPQLIGGLTMLAVGIVAGKILKRIIVRILIILGFHKITEESGADITLKKIGYRGRTADLIGDLFKWFIYLVALTATVDALGLTVVSSYFTQLANFVPRIIFAVIILLLGFLIADFVGNIAQNLITANMNKTKEKGRQALAKFSEDSIRIAIYLVSVILSLNVLGFTTEVLNILFGIIGLGLLLVLIIGSKDMLPNFVAGIHLQSKITVGDKIALEHNGNAYSGEVEHIGSITTTLSDRRELIEIPNVTLLNSIRRRKPKL